MNPFNYNARPLYNVHPVSDNNILKNKSNSPLILGSAGNIRQSTRDSI